MADGGSLRLTWVGHSTVRIELDGVTLLTDPLLRPRVMHLERKSPVAVEAGEDVDTVLISHAHYDHPDVRSLRMVGRAVPVILPIGGRRFLQRRGFRDVVELAEGEETGVGPVRVRAVFAEHSNLRASTIAFSPAFGYLTSGSQRVYFAGDTDLFPEMTALAPGLDVALLPIAGWGRTVGRGHLGPREAAQALGILRPRVVVPIHWGTYGPMIPSRPAPEPGSGPSAEFAHHAEELAPEVEVRILEPGASTTLARQQ
jgi:L-ascorbate metabolism protein UlaG (beta-lactamase superfamily)